MDAPQIDPDAGRRLREGLHRMGPSMNEIAALWHVEPRTLRSWIEGRRPVPGTVWRLLALELAARVAVRSGDAAALEELRHALKI